MELSLSAGQRSPGSSHMERPPSPPAQACARGPPTALRLHRSASSSTPCAAAACSQAAARLPNAGANPQPQPAGSQDNGNGKLVLPQLNNQLQPPHEAFKRTQASPPPASSSSQDQPATRPRPIPSQRRLTQQFTKEWPQYKDHLRFKFQGSRRVHTYRGYASFSDICGAWLGVGSGFGIGFTGARAPLLLATRSSFRSVSLSPAFTSVWWLA